jgi:hypothetical protein
MVETYQHQEFSNQRPYDHGHNYDAFAINHLNFYVTARLWWDTETDLDALLDEYYQLYYGPVREEMQAFFEYSEANWRELSRDAERLGAVLERIEAAQAAVDPGSVYARRVALVAEYVRPLYALRKQLQRPRAENIPRARALRVHALAAKTLDGRLDDPQYWPEVAPCRCAISRRESGHRVSSAHFHPRCLAHDLPGTRDRIRRRSHGEADPVRAAHLPFERDA